MLVKQNKSPPRHTPGPWQMHPLGRVAHYRISSDGVPNIAGVPLLDEGLGLAEANARLIAAAPELLSVLELIFPELEGSPYELAASAAIAKARGGTQ